MIVLYGVVCLSWRIFLELLLESLSLLAIHEEFFLHDIVILGLQLLFLLLNLFSWAYLIGDLFLKAVVCFHQSINLVIKLFLLGILFFFCIFDLVLELSLKLIFFFQKFSYFFLQSFSSFLQTFSLSYQWIIHILKLCEFSMLLLINLHLFPIFLLLRFFLLEHVLIFVFNRLEFLVLLF